MANRNNLIARASTGIAALTAIAAESRRHAEFCSARNRLTKIRANDKRVGHTSLSEEPDSTEEQYQCP